MGGFRARVRHGSALPGELEIAARAATRQGTCPIRLLDGYYTDHWVTEDLCHAFVCTDCVADPGDLGPTWDQGCDGSDDGSDIPF